MRIIAIREETPYILPVISVQRLYPRSWPSADNNAIRYVTEVQLGTILINEASPRNPISSVVFFIKVIANFFPDTIRLILLRLMTCELHLHSPACSLKMLFYVRGGPWYPAVTVYR